MFQSERDREWELLQALWNVHTIEIPRPRWYDASGELMGSKTIIMDHVTGTPLQLTLGPDADLEAARRIFLEVADALRAHRWSDAAGDGAAGRLGQLHRQCHRHLCQSRDRS